MTHSLPALLLAAILLTACASTADPAAPSSPTPPTPSPAASPSAEAPSEDAAGGEPIVASWEQGAPPVSLPNGDVLVDCDGDAPLLCVERDGETLGTLMLSTFEAPESLAGLEPGAELVEALRGFSDELHADVESDRASGCGEGYEFSPLPSVPTTIGGEAGLRYGFTGSEDNEVTERVMTYATVVGQQLWIVTVEAVSPEGCMASELTAFDPSVLQELLPVIDRVVAGTPLPAEA